MPTETRCPECGTALHIEEELLNSRVQCGECQRIFVAKPHDPRADEDAPDDRPRRRRRDYDDDDYGDYDDRPRRRRRPREEDQSGKATASLVLGCLGLVGWCLPIIGLPMTITGLILGVKGLKSENHGQAAIGVGLNVFGLMLSVANAAVGAYLGATGQHPMFK